MHWAKAVGAIIGICFATGAWAQGPRPSKRPGGDGQPAKGLPRPAPGALAAEVMKGSSVGVSTDTRLILRYDRDVGFEPGAADALPVGPDLLTAADGQVVALYDPVRREVLVATPSGVRGRFAARQVDALLIPQAGQVAVLDAAAGRVRVFSDAGVLQGELQLPTQTRSGERLVLEGTSLVAVDPAGTHREVAQLVGGKLVPPTRTGSLEPSLKLKASGNTLQLGGEKIEIPEAVRIAGRLIGGRPPWVELQIVRPGRSLDVVRRALRGRVVVELPVGERSYVPSMDVAASSSGELVYLEPHDGEVHVVWVTVR